MSKIEFGLIDRSTQILNHRGMFEQFDGEIVLQMIIKLMFKGTAQIDGQTLA